ncbi:AraC family transcriptional regulator [Phaeovulum sp.]|uniref:AraC family transcriptional regulator n=1 Tax=Phaeovulum sp. TaxID=2934796 RepID=UPI00272EFE37|nr:AraC family transcriptional regulator [Phaeovulum sp.]MDP1670222.1 AraC family transcriptional regulator [Phaeovulum sp.]MDP2062829.1 AraC family transcriptional regulator [Phaeovulum sp.]MDP3860178.1 AraC family transcriptional regulator [Phaeovulum sp.]MDZ4120282.1 AraC family transcriptional regulator [Phaeovulum sp.]
MKLFSATPLSQFASGGAGPVSAEPAGRRIISLLEPPSQIRIVPIQRLAAGGRWRIEAMRALSEPVLMWFTRGQGRITLGGVTRGYGTHNAVFIPAGVMHGFELGAQTAGIALYFGSGCDVTLPHSIQHLRIRESGPQTELSAILENIQREMESKRPGADRAARHHLGLLGVWLERQAEIAAADAKRIPAARRLAARYAALLERDFRTGLGVADMAAELGVTPTHLSRACREACGHPAHALLADRRLYEARRLLSETREPVKEIASVLGFTSPAYFTRAFHASTGKTPTAFRRGA